MINQQTTNTDTRNTVLDIKECTHIVRQTHILVMKFSSCILAYYFFQRFQIYIFLFSLLQRVKEKIRCYKWSLQRDFTKIACQPNFNFDFVPVIRKNPSILLMLCFVLIIFIDIHGDDEESRGRCMIFFIRLIFI